MFPLLGSSCKLSIASPSSHSTSASFCGQVKKELTSYQSNVDSPCGTFIQRRLSLWKVEFPPHIPSPSLLPSFRKVRNGKKSSSRVSDSVRSQDALALHCPKASRMKSVPAERLPSHSLLADRVQQGRELRFSQSGQGKQAGRLGVLNGLRVTSWYAMNQELT